MTNLFVLVHICSIGGDPSDGDWQSFSHLWQELFYVRSGSALQEHALLQHMRGRQGQREQEGWQTSERERQRGVREKKREKRDREKEERESLTSVPFSCRSSVLLVESDSTADTTCSPMCPTRFVLFIFLLVSHVFSHVLSVHMWSISEEAAYPVRH